MTIGIDLVDIVRMQRALQNTPALLQRLFHVDEQKLSTESLAARFAAKEALAKAIGNPSMLSWNEISIVNEESGKPIMKLHGKTEQNLKALGINRIELSLTHDGGMAGAVVMIYA